MLDQFGTVYKLLLQLVEQASRTKAVRCISILAAPFAVHTRAPLEGLALVDGM